MTPQKYLLNLLQYFVGRSSVGIKKFESDFHVDGYECKNGILRRKDLY